MSSPQWKCLCFDQWHKLHYQSICKNNTQAKDFIIYLLHKIIFLCDRCQKCLFNKRCCYNKTKQQHVSWYLIIYISKANHHARHIQKKFFWQTSKILNFSMQITYGVQDNLKKKNLAWLAILLALDCPALRYVKPWFIYMYGTQTWLLLSISNYVQKCSG